MLVAYTYIMKKGILLSTKYPYRGYDIFPCTYDKNSPATFISGFELLPPGNETLVLMALISVGPLSCAIDSSLPSFQNYKAGIYNDPACSKVINHAVLIVGT
jgi:hypothetical protein